MHQRKSAICVHGDHTVPILSAGSAGNQQLPVPGQPTRIDPDLERHMYQDQQAAREPKNDDDTEETKRKLLASAASLYNPNLILQPQLAAEVKSIYHGLTMIESKC